MGGIGSLLRGWEVRRRGRVLYGPNGVPLQIDTNEYNEVRVTNRRTLLDITAVGVHADGGQNVHAAINYREVP